MYLSKLVESKSSALLFIIFKLVIPSVSSIGKSQSRNCSQPVFWNAAKTLAKVTYYRCVVSSVRLYLKPGIGCPVLLCIVAQICSQMCQFLWHHTYGYSLQSRKILLYYSNRACQEMRLNHAGNPKRKRWLTFTRLSKAFAICRTCANLIRRIYEMNIIFSTPPPEFIIIGRSRRLGTQTHIRIRVQV